MRPGQETPDESRSYTGLLHVHITSMRPGQETPDELCAQMEDTHPEPTSMRPGQETPDEQAAASTRLASSGDFNEAGARNPG